MPTTIPDVTQKLKWTFWPTEYFSMDIKHFMAKNDPQKETKHYMENYQKRKKKIKINQQEQIYTNFKNFL